MSFKEDILNELKQINKSINYLNLKLRSTGNLSKEEITRLNNFRAERNELLEIYQAWYIYNSLLKLFKKESQYLNHYNACYDMVNKQKEEVERIYYQKYEED